MRWVHHHSSCLVCSRALSAAAALPIEKRPGGPLVSDEVLAEQLCDEGAELFRAFRPKTVVAPPTPQELFTRHFEDCSTCQQALGDVVVAMDEHLSRACPNGRALFLRMFGREAS